MTFTMFCVLLFFLLFHGGCRVHGCKSTTTKEERREQSGGLQIDKTEHEDESTNILSRIDMPAGDTSGLHLFEFHLQSAGLTVSTILAVLIVVGLLISFTANA